MSALRNIHGALRPGGLLLDIHPEPENSGVEARIGAQAIPLGRLDVSYRTATILTARAALQQCIDAGLFQPEREMTFAFTYHFANVRTWQAYMAENWSTAHIPMAVVERAHAALAGGVGEICIPRAIHAARLRALAERG